MDSIEEKEENLKAQEEKLALLIEDFDEKQRKFNKEKADFEDKLAKYKAMLAGHLEKECTFIDEKAEFKKKVAAHRLAVNELEKWTMRNRDEERYLAHQQAILGQKIMEHNEKVEELEAAQASLDKREFEYHREVKSFRELLTPNSHKMKEDHS